MIVGLNKYYKPIDNKIKFLKEYDIPMLNEAIKIAEFPKHVIDSVWEKKKKIELFSFFKNYGLNK